MLKDLPSKYYNHTDIGGSGKSVVADHYLILRQFLDDTLLKLRRYVIDKILHSKKNERISKGENLRNNAGYY